MLSREVVEVIDQGLFHIYTAEHVSEGIELLTGLPAGVADETGSYPQGSVLGHVRHPASLPSRPSGVGKLKSGVQTPPILNSSYPDSHRK